MVKGPPGMVRVSLVCLWYGQALHVKERRCEGEGRGGQRRLFFLIDNLVTLGPFSKGPHCIFCVCSKNNSEIDLIDLTE